MGLVVHRGGLQLALSEFPMMMIDMCVAGEGGLRELCVKVIEGTSKRPEICEFLEFAAFEQLQLNKSFKTETGKQILT